MPGFVSVALSLQHTSSCRPPRAVSSPAGGTETIWSGTPSAWRKQTEMLPKQQVQRMKYGHNTNCEMLEN